MSNVQTKEENKKKKLMIRIILTLLLLLLLAFTLNRCGYIRFPWDSETMVIGNVQQGHLSNLSPEELRAELQRAADENTTTIQLNSRPVFENGASAGSVFLGNPESNRFDMSVQYVHRETGEILYESGIIPPGYFIDQDKLHIPLEKGTHPVTAIITYLENGEIRNTTQFQIEVVVNN